MIRSLHREQFVPAPLREVWDFFSTPLNLNGLTPPDMAFTIEGEPGPMFEGQLIAYRIGIAPGIRLRWLTEIKHVKDQVKFVDEQRLGPYRFWFHEHSFSAVEGGTQVTDRVTYAMPFGPLGSLVHALWVGRQLRAIFDYRKIAVARQWPESPEGGSTQAS